VPTYVAAPSGVIRICRVQPIERSLAMIMPLNMTADMAPKVAIEDMKATGKAIPWSLWLFCADATE
jgi:hypothetical protein